LTIARLEVSRPPGVSARAITAYAPRSRASSSTACVQASVAGSIASRATMVTTASRQDGCDE
jgi:hypothetical protein